MIMNVLSSSCHAPCLKGLTKQTLCLRRGGNVLKKVEAIFTLTSFHLFNKIFIEFLFVTRQEETMIECFMSEKRMKNGKMWKMHIHVCIDSVKTD